MEKVAEHSAVGATALSAASGAPVFAFYGSTGVFVWSAYAAPKFLEAGASSIALNRDGSRILIAESTSASLADLNGNAVWIGDVNNSFLPIFQGKVSGYLLNSISIPRGGDDGVLLTSNSGDLTEFDFSGFRRYSGRHLGIGSVTAFVDMGHMGVLISPGRTLGVFEPSSGDAGVSMVHLNFSTNGRAIAYGKEALLLVERSGMLFLFDLSGNSEVRRVGVEGGVAIYDLIRFRDSCVLGVSKRAVYILDVSAEPFRARKLIDLPWMPHAVAYSNGFLSALILERLYVWRVLTDQR